MKSVLSKAVGGPETLVLEERPDPVAEPGKVVLSVKACGVNYPDFLMIQDMYQFKPERPFAPGGEVAGVVEAVGEGVSHVMPGDRVLASVGWGGMESGMGTTRLASTSAFSAMPPQPTEASTRSPAFTWVTPSPTASTIPGTAPPGA